MDTTPHHAIVPGAELTGIEAKRFLRLTDDEAALLQNMSPKDRSVWIKSRLPTKERLAMHLESLGHDDLAAKARKGAYSDFETDSATPQHDLLEDMRGRNGEARVHELVVDGYYDDTRAESDAWAKKQTGEMKQIIDAMQPPRTPAERVMHEIALKRMRKGRRG